MSISLKDTDTEIVKKIKGIQIGKQKVTLSLCAHKTIFWPGVVAHTYNPSTLEGPGGWITKSRDRDHPNQCGETPSLLKIQKLAGHGGVHL